MIRNCLILSVIFSMVCPAWGDDWPTYMHDNARSGVTDEQIDAGRLSLNWKYCSVFPPDVAWDEGARWDAFAKVSQVAMRDFDFAFYVTAVDDSVFFGSSLNHSISCLEADTGKLKWRFTTDGPVRFPPTYYKNKVYFGSDDGFCYCVRASDGLFVWKYSPSDMDSELTGNNGNLISMWPVRTATAAVEGRVYFAASLVNWESSYLCSVDAKTGKDKGKGLFKNDGGVTPMGSILLSRKHIYVPQGRLFPYVFDRLTGKMLGTVGKRGDGGCFALITTDEIFIYGSGRDHKSGNELREFDANKRDLIASHASAKKMIIIDNVSYMLTDKQICALRRKSGKIIWSNKTDCCSALIGIGDILMAGACDKVKALKCSDGKEIWSAMVKGRVRGLAAANGRVYVSTDTGWIYCFTGKKE